MAEAPNYGYSILPLKKLYFNLSQQLTAQDIDCMKELLKGNQLQQGDAEKVETAMELFNHLEDKGYISKNNLELLIDLFATLEKSPLVEIVDKFMEDRTNRRKPRKRKARELSIKASLPTYDDKFTLNFITRKVYENVDLTEEGALKKVEDHLKNIKGILVEEFKDGCIECVVMCETMDALETLWSQYKSGELQAVFQKAIITDELLKSLHAEYITMEVTISEEEYRKCREEVKAREEYDKALQEYRKTRKEYWDAKEERHGLEAAEEGWREARQGLRDAQQEWWRKWEAWESMLDSADDLEAANIQIQTMKADAEEQTEKLSKEMDIVSEQLEIKGGRMQELEAKLEFKSEQEINDEIRKLKSELESGFTREDEKSAIKKQISSLENTLREYLALQGGIDSDRTKQEQIQQEREIVHEKADRLNEMQNKVMEGIRRMTLMER